MNQDELTTVEADSSLPLPGQLIRQTREQRGLSVADLSEKSRLTENVINAVEQDNYSAMGEPVYARGYYRKCGDVLGLNAERLVEAYEQHSGTGSPVPTIEQRPSIAYREGPGRLALGIAVGLMVLVFLVCGVWVLGDDEPGPAEQPQVENRDTAPALAATPGPVKQLPDNNNVDSGSSPLQAGAASSASQESLQAAQATPAPEQPESAQAQTVAGQQHASMTQPTPQATSIAELAEQTRIQPIAAGAINLRVEIEQGEAWVDISDSAGKKLLYKLLKDGEVRNLQGQVPLRVSLGRADHVRLLINGEVVDFASQIDKGLTAKFLLDARRGAYDAARAETP